MDSLEVIVAEGSDVGMIVDEIFEVEVIEDGVVGMGVAGDAEDIEFVGTAEVKVSEHVLLPCRHHHY